MYKKRMKNWLNIFSCSLGMILTSFVAVIMAFLSYSAVFPSTHQQSLLVSYNTNDDVSYQIKTNANSFFSDNDLAMNQRYVSSIINKIVFTVNYSFNSSKLLNYTYKYKINAELIGDYVEGSENDKIWSKDFVISPETSISVNNDNSINIDKTFEIDYQTYNQIMQSFKKEFNLSINAYLKINFVVNVKSLVGEKNQINQDDNIEINIPLLQDTTYIKYNKTGLINKNVMTTVDTSSTTNYLLIIIYATVFFVALGLDIMFIINSFKVTTKDRYYYELNKIYKEYSDVLVAVSVVPNHNELTMVKITNFKDMLDINEEINSPILYYEEKNKTNFFIMNDKYYYTYTIKKEKLLKKKGIKKI